MGIWIWNECGNYKYLVNLSYISAVYSLNPLNHLTQNDHASDSEEFSNKNLYAVQSSETSCKEANVCCNINLSPLLSAASGPISVVFLQILMSRFAGSPSPKQHKSPSKGSRNPLDPSRAAQQSSVRLLVKERVANDQKH